MPFGLPVLLLTLAQAAGSAPAASTAPAAVPKPAPDGCRTTLPTNDTRTIVVCAQKPQGYRLDPDVMEARREARNHSGPKPREMMKDNPCATVGPMGCRGNAGIDLVNAAAVLAQMAAKLNTARATRTSRSVNPADARGRRCGVIAGYSSPVR